MFYCGIPRRLLQGAYFIFSLKILRDDFVVLQDDTRMLLESMGQYVKYAANILEFLE